MRESKYSALRWTFALLGAALAFPAAAQNAIPNAEFELVDGVSGWNALIATSWLPDGVDANGCEQSHSGIGVSAVYGQPNAAQYFNVDAPGCLTVSVGQTVYIDLMYWAGGVDSVRPVLKAFSGAQCDGSSLGFYQPMILGETFEWTRAQLASLMSIANTASVRLAIDAWDAVDLPFPLALDRAYIGLRQRIFSDDFEGDDSPCRWSAAVP